jgi:hypothetical protein
MFAIESHPFCNFSIAPVYSIVKQRYVAKKRKQSKQKLEQIQLQGKKDIEAAQRQCLDDVQSYREGIKDEHDKIVDSVAPKMETAAALFAKNIISHRI